MPSCCVPFCKSIFRSKTSKCYGENPKFHKFPMDKNQRDAWIKVIARKDLDITKTRHVVICSIHFRESDYEMGSKRQRLKKGVVPSVFPGYPSYMIPKPTIKRSVRSRPSLEVIPKRKYSLKKPRVEEVEVTTNESMDRNTLEDISIKYLKITMLETSNLDIFLKNSQSGIPSDINTNTNEREKILLEYLKSGDDTNNDTINENVNATIQNNININELQSGLKCEEKRTRGHFEKQLERKIRILNSKIFRLKNKIKKQDEEKLGQELRYERLNKELERINKTAHFEELRKINTAVRDEKSTCGSFLLNLIDNFSKDLPKFTKQTLKQCAIWRNASLDGYKFARTFMTLPSVLTLKKYQKLNNIEKDTTKTAVNNFDTTETNLKSSETVIDHLNSLEIEKVNLNSLEIEERNQNLSETKDNK